MFYLWLNMLWLFITSKLFLSKIDPLADLTRSRRVSIFDCEGLRFMSNTRYIFYTELLRYELMFRSKWFELTAQKRIYATLGSQKIIYRRPLKLWSKFTITLKLEGWDDKWFYHSATFKQKNQVCTLIFTKMAFWKNKETLSLGNFLSELSGQVNMKMSLSPEISKLFEDDSKLLKKEKG